MRNTESRWGPPPGGRQAARRTENPSGDRRTREAKAASRKARGNHNPADRGSIRGNPRPERVLTRVWWIALEATQGLQNQGKRSMRGESRVNTAKDDLNWHDVDWRRAEKTVRNLRRRIFRASREGDMRRVRNLQRLMLKSRANRLLAVRRVSRSEE